MFYQGCAINLISDPDSYNNLMEIKEIYATTITELPADDVDAIEKTVKEAVDESYRASM